jgi:hypothetical protein
MSALVATPAFALFTTGDALVIGNARYGEVAGAFGPPEVQAVARALRLRGQQVEAVANAGHTPMTQAFETFVRSISTDETPLVVVLSGMFAQEADGVYLRPAGRDPVAAQGGTAAAGLSVSAVLDVLAQSPRRAFLVLGETGAVSDPAPGAGSILDRLAIPDGVTVIHGPADQVARFAAVEMAQPGERLARTAEWYDLTISGYLSETLVVLEHTEVRPPTEDEQAAALDRARASDDRAWRRAMEADSLDAYQAYLDSFPGGQHASEAHARAEGALGLSLAARRMIQRDLTRLGHETRGIDGIFGPATRSSVMAWQKEVGAEATGYLLPADIAQIAAQAGGLPQPAPLRSAPPPVPRPSAQETAIWSRTQGEADLRNYLGQFPNGAHAERARVLLSNIQRGSSP